MNAFGVVIVVFIALVILSVITRLARGIVGTRNMSGEGHWPADGVEIQRDGGIEPRGHHHGDHGSHHASHHTSHHASHHDIASHHHIGGGGDIGGGGHHHG